MADRVERDVIDCDFRRRASYAYVGRSRPLDAEREAEAALAAGLPASLVDETPLPYPVAAAVRFDDQAEFHVRKYLLALAEQLDEVYEHSHAVQIDDDERCTVKTPGGNVTADHVVVATHYPFLDRALAFARVSQQRSYALCAGSRARRRRACSSAATRRPAPSAPSRSTARSCCWSAARATRPARAATPRSATARSSASPASTWTYSRSSTAGPRRTARRSTACPTSDRSRPCYEEVLFATGFAKWGMTGGTAAGMLLADRVLGRENPWAGLFDPNRSSRAPAGTLAEENAKVAQHFLGDRLTARHGPIETWRPARATS